MIVDSHAHIFPPMGGASGHPSMAEHLRYVQHTIMTHHQPVRRASDNVAITHQTLFDGEDVALDAMYDVDFRGGGHGKFVWTYDGVDYLKQYLPPSMRDLESTPEYIIAQMDYAGIDRAVIQSGHLYGRLNDYIAEAVTRFPDRFWGLALVDEWNAADPAETRSLDIAIHEYGLHALWFNTGSLEMHRRDTPVDDPDFFPFWDRVRALGIPVFWNVTTSVPGQDSYLYQLAAFKRWLNIYPDVPCVLTHGLTAARFIEDGVARIPEAAWKAIDAPNVISELLFPIFQGAVFDYPYREVRPIIREYYERLGPNRLCWGSDMPNVERHATYRQSLAYLGDYCDFIPQDDMDAILGRNIAALFDA